MKNSLFPNHSYEVHLGNEIKTCEDFHEKNEETELSKKILNVFENIPLKVIHTPLYKEHPYYIEEIETQEIFEYVVHTAENIREKQNVFENVIVVVHNLISLKTMIQYGILNKVVSLLKAVAEKYPHVEIAIEHGIYAYEIDNTDYYSNIELAEICNKTNIGLCIRD